MGTGIFFNVPAHGHINPTLPIVNELVKRGETIIYFSTEEFRDKIEQAGAKFKPYSFTVPKGTMAGGNFVKLIRMLLLATEEVMLKTIEYIRQLDPDYIIHDSMCPWGKYISKYFGIKAINTTSTFVFTEETTNKADRFKKKLMKMVLAEGISGVYEIVSIRRRLKIKYGVHANMLDLVRNIEDLNVVFTSLEFQPDGAKLGDKFKFIGPSIYDRKDAVEFSFERIKGKKLVYISLGTIVNERLGFYKECIKAFSKSDYNILIAVGNKLNKNNLGQTPANIIIENYVPQIEVLKCANLFISHGGMNSVSEALFFGVPLLIIPQQSEQVMVGKRVEELGAGICITEKRITSGDLFKTSIYIMGNSLFYESARKIGASFKASGGYKAGVDAILNYILEK